MPHESHDILRNAGITFLGAQINMCEFRQN
jgi:hypothetical protein